MVSFYTYFFISIHDKTLLIFMLSWACSIMPINNINTQTMFMVLFTSGSLFTWGKPSDASSGVSPRYLSTTHSQLTISPFFYRNPFMTDCTFFSLGPDRWKKDLSPQWGHLTICPPLWQFHFPSVTNLELSSLMSLKAWGGKQEACQDITYLVVQAEEEATQERTYGLLTIWVNPCQARVHSMEEMVRELTAWVSSGPGWVYTLVWLHEDTCHAPLLKEGHLGILLQGEADMSAYGKTSQLEVCQLLVSGPQVAYPVGLNGCEEPIITSLPKSLANGVSLTGGKPIYLEIDILQPMAEEPDQQALPIGKLSTIIIASPHKTTPQSWKERSA